MGALEDLAAALAGDNTQQMIAAENPYFQIKELPDSISELTLKTMLANPGVNTNQGLALSVGSGVLSGLLNVVGKKYQNTLTDRYQKALFNSLAGNPVDSGSLPPNLFGQVNTASKLFNMQRGLGLQDKLETATIQNSITAPAAKERAIISALSKATTTRQKNLILDSLREAGLIEGTKSEPTAVENIGSASKEGAQTDTNRGIEGNLLDSVSREANKLMDEGAKPEQAFATAREMLKTKQDELERQYKRVEESQKSGADLKGIVGQLRSALSDAGDTGYLGNAKQLAAGALGVFSEGQHKKYAAGQDVETFAGEAVKNMGPAFKGPMSDRDVAIMLKTAPSLGTEEETNKKILDRWSYAAELQQTYSDFMRAAQAKGVDVSKAEQAWSELKKANPYVIKVNGEYEINPAWIGGNPLEESSVAGASGSWGSEANSTAGLKKQVNTKTGEVRYVPR